MFKQLTKDFLNRQKLHKQKLKRFLFASLQKSAFSYYKRLFWFHKKSRPVFLTHWAHNCCQITGRTRGVVSSFKKTRHVVKLEISQALMYGYHKTSW